MIRIIALRFLVASIAVPCSPTAVAPEGRPPMSVPVAAASVLPATTTRSSATTSRKPIAIPARPWQPSLAAVTVATRYVTAALSYTWTEPPTAWIRQVASYCTPQWAAALGTSADGGIGGWTAVVTGRERATAKILAVYPSAGPGPGRRLEITAQITTTSRTRHTVADTALAVDVLSQPGGAWLVGWAG